MNAEEFTRRSVVLATELPVDGETPSGWELIIETYRLGETYFTTISSADAGARFARGRRRVGDRTSSPPHQPTASGASDSVVDSWAAAAVGPTFAGGDCGPVIRCNR
jgi:hypothetical protein